MEDRGVNPDFEATRSDKYPGFAVEESAAENEGTYQCAVEFHDGVAFEVVSEYESVKKAAVPSGKTQ